MCGSFKPLYLQTRRKGVATLSPSLTHRSLRVDGRGNGWTGINKGSFSEQPILAVPNIGEPMLLYISATYQVVSAVLVIEREEDDTNSGSKSRHTTYPLSSHHANPGTHITKKIAYVFFMASRKLQHYFQECSITVASEVPPRCHGPDCQVGHRAPPIRHNI